MAVGVLTPGRGDGFMGDVAGWPSLPSSKTRPTYVASTCTSLPPLPNYGLPEKFRKFWGEDEELEERLGTVRAGFSNFRYNFDCCTPDADVYSIMPGYRKLYLPVTNFKYEHKTNTSRRAPRDATCKVFPINNPLRKASDGQYVLSEPTRRALDEYTTSLYRTSRDSRMFMNQTNHMKLRMERDAQFARECPTVAAPTCPRIHIHPDPCPMCWAGGFNHDFVARNVDAKTCKSCATTTATKHSHFRKKWYVHEKVQNWEKSTTTDVHANEQESERHENADDACHCEECVNQRACISLPNDNCKDEILKQKMINENNEPRNEIKLETTIEQFGPWSETGAVNIYHPPEDEEAMLVPHIYHFQLPSSAYCRCVQNDDVTPILDDDGRIRYCTKPIHPLAASCREPTEEKPVPVARTKCVTFEDSVRNSMMSEKNLRNRWTFRDENNLRRPCISKVIGTLNKSDAHTRFHSEHQEVVPDLRDFRRAYRRVNFYGYNSSVFR